MKIERFEVIDRCLFWKEKKILITADAHLGYEEFLNEMGWVFPKTQFELTEEIFKKVFKKTGKLSKIIILGDVKHHIGGILREEFGDFYKLTNLFRKNLLKNGEIMITKGDHDKILEPVVKNYSFVRIVDYEKIGDVMFFHGNRKDFNKHSLEVHNKNVRCLVVGHFHPAVTIEQDAKREKYKCFLIGKSKEYMKDLIVLPSFFPLVEGTNVLEDSLLEGWMDVSKFEVFVLDENGNVYDFGRVKGLR